MVLGGHSLGASLTLAYASWDFGGGPGYKDLDGLVLIDGGLLGSFDAYDLAQAKQAISDLRDGNPFAQLLGPGLPPESAGLFAEVGGLYARLAPHEPATALQEFPLLPPELNPPFPVTDRALLGYGFDRDTSPLGSRSSNQWRPACDIRRPARLGQRRRHPGAPARRDLRPGALELGRVVLPTTTDDRHQRSGPAPRQRGCALPGTTALPYPPGRLAAVRAPDGPHRRPRPWGALRFIDRSRTTRSESRLVNADPEESHLDPLMADPAKNRFFKTLVPFLRHKVFGAPEGG